jgi:glycosyltransferase involved in cell wall biosynthesis
MPRESDKKDGITCVMHTRDSAATVERALRSVAWVEELVVADMASRDETLEIAARFDAVIISVRKHPRVDGIRNECLEKATQPWILVLDSDEYLADDAEALVRELIATHQHRYDAFRIPRFNYIANQVMRGSRWYPDFQTRLFRKGTVAWDDAVHRQPVVLTGSSRALTLRPPDCIHLHHQNYSDLREFVERQVHYALNRPPAEDPDDFDFSEYIAEAYTELSLRRDPERDGDLSHALALLMAWDSIVRGLVRWDSLDPRPPLDYLTALPIAAQRANRPQARLRRWLGRHYPVSYFLRRVRDRLHGLREKMRRGR